LATAPDASSSILADGFTLLERGRTFDRDDIAAAADRLAARLAGARAGRVALPTSSCFRLLCGLAAAERTHVDLVLLRHAEHAEDAARAAGADVLLDDDLNLVVLGAPATPPATGRIWLQTSGTSGVPKLVAHAPARLRGRIAPGGRPATWLLTYDAGGFAGLQVVLSAAMGGHRLVAAPGASATELAALAAAHEVTHVSATPSFWRIFLMALDATGAPPLRHITVGGEAVDQPLLDALRARFPAAALRHIYASTEAGAVFAVTDGQAGFPAAWLREGRDGVALDLSAGGTLLVQSPRSALDAAASGGWVDTGDIIAIEGTRAFFAGRVDTVVNVGGVKVSPETVERVLMTVPGVANLVVRAKPNPISGMILVAEVVPGDGVVAADLDRSLKHAAQGLPPAARPRLYRYTSGIEVTAAGKKDRKLV